jgi:uncharacterized protein YaaN involved in tellurite resistance
MSQPQLQKEVGLDDFDMASEPLKAPPAVNEFKPEDLKEKVGQVNAETGEVKTFSKLEKDVINKLDSQVESLARDLLTAPMHSTQMKELTSALGSMGDKEINETSQMSNRMLQTPLKTMRQNDAGDGKSVANALKQLRMKVTELDPSRRDSFKGKLFGFIPFGIGKKVDSYMQEFKSSESQLNDIVKALMNGRDELLKDNASIEVERENMQKLMQRLEQYAYIMKKLDQRIEEKLPQIEAEDRLRASDIRQEVLFPMRQKSMDLYQHLAVCMQGYMSLQVIKQNNHQLVLGVNRATKTTMAALRTAVIVSEALGTQKLVLDQIESVNETTNNLLARNAEMLKTQGVAIQKQATNASVNPQTLEKSFQQIFQAMDAIDKFREEALPNMKKTVESLESSVNNAKAYLSQHRADRIGNFADEVIKEESMPDDGVVRVMK